MGSLISNVPKIRDLRFYPIPNRPLKVQKAIRIDNVTIILGQDDRLYVEGQLAGRYCFTHGNWPWLDGTMRALLKLGVLIQEEVDEHLEWNRLYSEFRDRRNAAERLLDNAETAGIKLTAYQRRKIEAQLNETSASVTRG